MDIVPTVIQQALTHADSLDAAAQAAYLRGNKQEAFRLAAERDAIDEGVATAMAAIAPNGPTATI